MNNAYDFSEIERPEDFDGTAPVPAGDAHAMISGVDLAPTKLDGTPMDGMRVTFTVAAHSQPGQLNRQHSEIFWNPDGPEPYPGARKDRLKMLGKLAIVTGLATRDRLVGNTNVAIDWMQMVGCQVCIRLKRSVSKKDPTKEYINIDDRAVAIYTVDEDAAKNFPKSAQLSAIARNKPGGGQGGQGGQPAPQGGHAQQQPAPQFASQPLPEAAGAGAGAGKWNSF